MSRAAGSPTFAPPPPAPLPAAATPLRVLLCDQHHLVRAAMAALLSPLDGVHVAAEASNATELIAAAARVRPHLVLTEILMPGADPVTAIRALRQRHPGLAVLVLSAEDAPHLVRRAVANGASGYLTKHSSPEELRSAIATVARGRHYYSPRVTRRLLEPPEQSVTDELTLRQMEILARVAQGRATRDIASELGLSPKTIDVHRSRIKERLQLHDTASLTRYAVRKGLVTENGQPSI